MRTRSIANEERRTTYSTQYGLSRLCFVIHSWYELVPTSFRQRPTSQPGVSHRRPRTSILKVAHKHATLPTVFRALPLTYPYSFSTNVCFVRWLVQNRSSIVRYYSTPTVLFITDFYQWLVIPLDPKYPIQRGHLSHRVGYNDIFNLSCF
jgi:hypothetical protein